jgi:hypothetical protein
VTGNATNRMRRLIDRILADPAVQRRITPLAQPRPRQNRRRTYGTGRYGTGRYGRPDSRP